MALQARIGEVTARVARRSHAAAAPLYLDRIESRRPRAGAQEARLRQFRPRLRRLRAPRQGGAEGRRRGQPRHRHRLQRHAFGASALRALSRPHQARGARGGRHGAGRGRRAGDVRRRHPGRGRHGPLAVLARRDRALDRRRAVAPDVRRGGLSRRLRQDRAGPADRRVVVRPSAGRVHPGGADALGAVQRREVEDPPALRRGQGDRAELLEAEAKAYHCARHLHLLRHRQHQPDADGDHGPAPAGRLVRQPEHAAARRADRARRQARAGTDRRAATPTRRSAT